MRSKRPLLCVVDDAQWRDQASALTLAFVARRLLAERVGIVFAARESGEALAHVPELEVRGLPNDDARALLGSIASFVFDERVRERLIAPVSREPGPGSLASGRVGGWGAVCRYGGGPNVAGCHDARD